MPLCRKEYNVHIFYGNECIRNCRDPHVTFRLVKKKQKSTDVRKLNVIKIKLFTSVYFVCYKSDLSQTRTLKRKEADMTLLKEFDLNWEYGPCTGESNILRA